MAKFGGWVFEEGLFVKGNPWVFKGKPEKMRPVPFLGGRLKRIKVAKAG